MRVALKDLAKVIRSKNAGPFTLTFDILFKDQASYEMFKEKKCLNKEVMAKAYGVTLDEVEEIIYFDPSNAIKINFHRPLSSGDVGETDVYGAQQHIPLMNLEFDV